MVQKKIGKFDERTVRPELVEGQSRIVANEAVWHHEDWGVMLRQAFMVFTGSF